MTLGRLLGAEIRLDPWLVAGGALAIALGWGPETVIFAAALLLHELGHLAAAAAEEVAVVRVVLHPFGGVAQVEGLEVVERGRLMPVALAGPAASLALAAVAAYALRHGPPAWGAGGRLGLWLDANLALGLVNLVPVLPLDGGQAVRAHLAERFGMAVASHALARAGQGLGVALAAGAALGLALGLRVADVGVFGAFLALAAGREVGSGAYARTVAAARRRAALARGAVLAGRVLVAGPDVPLLTVWRAMAPRAYHEVRVVDGEGRRLGCLDEVALAEAMERLGPRATLADALARPPPRRVVAARWRGISWGHRC
ncbi:MAG: hypothetical protein K6V73_10655 [Firmicutes bacterium]|nr:hypothetical protein [Bacillota bacterium]